VKRAFLLALLLILPACASTTNVPRDTVAVVWNRVDDTQSACQELTGKKEIYAVRGCSKWNDSQVPGTRVCNVYARLPKNESDTQAFATLGHEMMHCFEGNWHDRWGRMLPQETQSAAAGSSRRRAGTAAQVDGE
jgi:hypothetical protein